MLEELKKYIEKCPHLNGGKIGIDYLGTDLGYVIETSPVSQIVTKYVDGSSLMQLIFIFASLESYGADVIQNLLNSKFYEDFVNWIEEQNQSGNLPAIDGIESIECLTTPYAYQTDENTARYQIQLKILYRKVGK